MKNLLFLLLFAALNYAATAQQPIQDHIRNTTACTIKVTKECYDICVLVSSTSVTVPPNTPIQMSSLGSCGPQHGVVYKVCWVVDDSCRKDPIIPCVRVDGNPAAPSPCGPGTTTGIIRAGCPECRPQNGTATVEFQAMGVPNSLLIH